MGRDEHKDEHKDDHKDKKEQEPQPPPQPQIPQCAGLCIFANIDVACCNPVSLDCLCTSKPFIEAVTKCVLKECPVPDYIPTVKFLKTTCGPSLVNAIF
ncbi:hypothetical protein V1512DRAFT_247833 [Lipomyces arxii]|uniref:uncharacterized protein n=1 Tax=Lipomyces arxii TaxID=56418 RepID=UPI0034CE086D